MIEDTSTRLMVQAGCSRNRGFMGCRLNIFGNYFTEVGQCYCSLNEVCYSEHYFEILHRADGTNMTIGHTYYLVCIGRCCVH
jgi:hypothetical protein